MYKVLVVDDEFPIRQWLKFCIDKIEGFEVVGMVANGAEGLSFFKKYKPDIVITDIRMPGMDGLEMIDMIRNINVNSYIILLTSHEDFSYARRAMQVGIKDYILKTEISDEKLKNMLENVKLSIIKENNDFDNIQVEEEIQINQFIRSLLSEHKCENHHKENLAKYFNEFINCEYVVLDVYSYLNGQKFILDSFENINKIKKFNFDIRHFLLVISLVDKNILSENTKNKKIIEICNKILSQGDFRIGISQIQNRIDKFDLSIREAYDACNQRYYFPKQKIFRYDANKKSKIEGDEVYKLNFSKALAVQKFDKVTQIKDEVRNLIQQEKPKNIERVKQLYSYLMITLIHFTEGDMENIEKYVEEIRHAVHSTSNFEELNNLCDQLFSKMIVKREILEYSQCIQKAIQFIELNFDKQISLADVANHVSLSPEYLSRLFKEETGIKFIVYLNNVRLKNALKLLETTNLKVYEIAEKVGYANLSYFSTVFKKNFGNNPFEYKKKLDVRVDD